MKFKLIETEEIFDMDAEMAFDTIIYGDVWKCLETDKEKVNDFFLELDEISANDGVHYNLFIPEILYCGYDEEYVTEDICRIAAGETFQFDENDVFIFINDK